MKTITIELSEDIESELQRRHVRAEEALRLGVAQLRLQEALHLYRSQLVTIGRAAEVAGVSREEMIRHARAAGLKPHYSEQMVSEDLRVDTH
jgi:predicted HTH domain antitoxin